MTTVPHPGAHPTPGSFLSGNQQNVITPIAAHSTAALVPNATLC